MSSAADYDVVVVGGGVAGLVAAIECLRVGARVVVLEASESAGGSVARLDIAGLAVDAGADSFATRGGHVAAYLEELGLAGDIVSPAANGSWLHLSGGRTVPSPKAGVLGIPSVPLAADVTAAIGGAGAARAYLDRLMPVLKIGREHSLAELVEKRMGRRVLEDLVAPVVSGVYSTRPENIDIDVAQPGLNGAITRLGSLSGAVAELRENAPAGAAARGIRGGMFRMVDALIERLRYFGGEIRTGVPVAALEAGTDDAPWRVRLPEGELLARAVILAVPEAAARSLIGDASAPAEGDAEVELVTLVLDDPRLDAAPRGTGVLVAPTAEGVTAKALTHATAKWAWLADAADPGRHVLRLSYGRPEETRPLDGLTAEDVRTLAVRDASLLLGVELDGSSVVEHARIRWSNVRSAAAIGQKARIDAFLAELATHDGIAATGTWLAGTGLASVIPHARATAVAIRHRLVRQGIDIPREEYVGDDYSGTEAPGQS